MPTDLLFEERNLQSYENVESLILRLADIAYKLTLPVGDTFWFLVQGIREEIINKDPLHPEWRIKEKIISLIEVNLLTGALRSNQTAGIGYNPDAELQNQLDCVGAFLRLLPDQEIYEPAKMLECFINKDQDFDPYNLIRSFRSNWNNEKMHDFIMYIVDFICEKEVSAITEYSWYDNLTFTLILHSAYNQFSRLDRDRQGNLLKNYFYRGIIVNAPVKPALSDYLYSTTDIDGYLLEDKFILDNLKENSESVLINLMNNVRRELKVLWGNYLANTGAELESGYQLAEFVEQVYANQKNADRFSFWLREAVGLFVKIKEADLIDHNLGGEETEDFVYKKDLDYLVIWFASPETWKKIVSYYQKPDPFVPLKNFLSALASAANLDDADVLQKLVDFNQFLLDNKILQPGQDLLLFDEADSAFHWNEELIELPFMYA